MTLAGALLPTWEFVRPWSESSRAYVSLTSRPSRATRHPPLAAI